MGKNSDRATAIAVLPLAVGPMRTGTSGLRSPKPAFQFPFRELDDGRATVNVVRRKLTRKQLVQQIAHLHDFELMTCHHGRTATVGGSEAFESVRHNTKSIPSQVRDHLLQTPARVEPRVRVGNGMEHHGSPPERLDLEPNAFEEIFVRIDGLELRGIEVDGDRQQQAL